ncbi:MAG: DNA polymerase/3'-5' exonuclease PolX [Syntrophomonadaceae bacterium]|jgi:DNA polymerase (family 10)
MTNLEVARMLNRIAALLQLKDENPFKIRAYRNAARSIYHLEQELRLLYEQNRLQEIPGVGKTVQAQIEELMKTGSLAYYQQLTAATPETVLDLLTVPGLGPKTVALIYSRLGIDNLADLQAAAQAHMLRKLPGLGAKTEEAVLQGIALLKQGEGKISIGLALPAAEKLVEYLRSCLPGAPVRIVGSLRRGKPLVSDADILIASGDSDAVAEALAAYPGIEIKQEDRKHIGGYLPHRIPFEVIMAEPADFALRLLWTTGSKAHRARIFAEHSPDEFPAFKDEKGIYESLQMAYIPAALREDRGEIEAARRQNIPPLVKLQDIKGDLHVHSDWSDGAPSLMELFQAASARGYEYLAVTDHSHSLPVTGGLNPERLRLQGKVIAELNHNKKGPHILSGIEVEILKDGSLDLSDADLEKLDVVIASIHSHFKLDVEEQTERLLKVIANPHVDIIGHLTGRLFNKRDAYDLDLERILKAAAYHHKVLEINAHPDRLDIDEEVARRAVSLGIKIAINSDAHHINEMDLLRYGILNARRGWVQAADVINTWSLEQLLAYIRSGNLST